MTFVVTDDRGRPVAASDKLEDAQSFAYRNTCGKIGPGDGAMEWTGTGKLMVSGRWSGWEVREVSQVGAPV